LAESAESYKNELDDINNQLNIANNKLQEARLKADAIVEVNKRAEMEKE